MARMYSMNDTLNKKETMSNPKKENIFHSMFNVVNTIWKQFTKVPASFIASLNYPLSVTVVHNEGIITQEFFKNLTTKNESLNTDNVYIRDKQIKEPLNIVDSIQYGMFNKKSYVDKIFNEHIDESLNFSYKYIETENEDTNNCNVLIPMENSSKEMDEYVWLDVNSQEVCTLKNFYNSECIHNHSTCNKGQLSDYIDDSLNNKSVTTAERSSSTSGDVNEVQSQRQTTVSNLLTNMWQKVVDSVSDRFCKTDSMEPDIAMKRLFSPKQRRKVNAIAKGRGRGRARSQLRRSGVSQTRHRKERTKHDLDVDIQSDLESWLELEMYDANESKELEDNCFSLDKDTIDGLDTSEFVIQAVHPVTYTFADIKPKVQKQKTRKIIDQGVCKYSARMKSIPECMEDASIFYDDYFEDRYRSQKSIFRPRLISESSIDSEDSYCIVFENGSEVTCKSDLDDSEDSDTDESSEDEEVYKNDTLKSPVHKVKFNLNPTVHTMVQWDYAYRAARRGPWEEIARDRGRFRGRINCIERVLNPILTVQHRTHIWQQRFACNE